MSNGFSSAGIADRLNGRVSARELVVTDLEGGFRWFQHDYPTTMARWNHHPEFELHLIRSGTGKLLVGDHVGEFRAGHIALIGPNLPHDWMSDLAPGETIADRDAVLQFDGARLRKWGDVFPDMEELGDLLDAAGRGIEFTGATARAAAPAMEAVGSATGLERLSRLFHLLAVLARSPASDRVILAGPLFATATRADLEEVIRYILENIEERVSLSEAARLAGMTDSRFSRMFRHISGHNFVDFVRKLRIAQACRMLRQTDLPVSSICFDVGFNNLSNFNRQFLAETGVSPSSYRRQTHEKGQTRCS